MEEQTRVLEYKCPCCNAGLHFGSDAQKLTCEYCGNTFDIDTVRAFNESQNPQGGEEFQWESGTDGVNSARMRKAPFALFNVPPAAEKFSATRILPLPSAPTAKTPPSCPPVSAAV